MKYCIVCREHIISNLKLVTNPEEFYTELNLRRLAHFVLQTDIARFSYLPVYML